MKKQVRVPRKTKKQLQKVCPFKISRFLSDFQVIVSEDLDNIFLDKLQEANEKHTTIELLED